MRASKPRKHSAFQDNGRGNQSYLFPCSVEWSIIIENHLPIVDSLNNNEVGGVNSDADVDADVKVVSDDALENSYGEIEGNSIWYL